MKNKRIINRKNRNMAVVKSVNDFIDNIVDKFGDMGLDHAEVTNMWKQTLQQRKFCSMEMRKNGKQGRKYICGARIKDGSEFCSKHRKNNNDDEKKAQCSAINSKGKQCSKNVVQGTKYCTVHENGKNQKIHEAKEYCQGKNKKGENCSRYALKEENYCKIHLPMYEKPEIVPESPKPERKVTRKIKGGRK